MQISYGNDTTASVLLAWELRARRRGTNVEKRGGERIALFDNIKGILIVLVVLGHVAHPIHNENPVLSVAFDIIYLFHMPLFVFMSGLFAKGAYRGGRLNIDRILSFLALGFGFQLALALVNGATLTPARILAFTSAPWYLVSMACWYALTPALAHLGARRGMALSLAASLLWGMVDLSSGLLAISRTVAFLPCFALGYYLDPQDILRVRTWKGAPAAVAFALAATFVRTVNPDANEWFFPMVYGDNPYEQGLFMGMIQKLTALGVAGAFSIALIKLAPERRCALTALGRRTLQVYILHRLIRAWLTFHTPLYDSPWMVEAVPGTLAVVALTAIIVLACATPVFERPFARLLKIRWTGQRAQAVND